MNICKVLFIPRNVDNKFAYDLPIKHISVLALYMFYYGFQIACVRDVQDSFEIACVRGVQKKEHPNLFF